jgi:hypothetical protein
MSCSTTTGLSEMRHADSDSVNLGSNPSPPATQILEKYGFSAIRHNGQVGLSEHFGRTEPGTAPGEVYFITDGDAIKIGWSGAPKVRIKDLQATNPRPLRILLSIQAHPYDERILHARFAHLRLTGEWFRSEPELTDFIETARTWPWREPPRRSPRVRVPAAPSKTKAMHALLDQAEVQHRGNEAVAGRIRILRHSLRLLAGGEDTAEMREQMARTVADLATVIPTVSARTEP